MLCICGVCIPYSLIWPFILMLLKKVYDVFFPPGKNDKKSDKKESLVINVINVIGGKFHGSGRGLLYLMLL